MSVRTAHRATQRLRCAAALLVLQLKLKFWHDTGKCSIHPGWSGKSRSLDVFAPVAGSVQPARKGDDSHGHVFSSSFSQGYQAHVYPRESSYTIWWESFSEEQGRKQAVQYWSYEASFQESPFQEVLQTMQETWEHAYYARYHGPLQVRERRNSESQFLRCQEGW